MNSSPVAEERRHAMTPLMALLIAFMASVLAGVCAYADGALLAVDTDQPPADR